VNYPHQKELDWLAVDGKSLRSTLRDFGDKSQNFVMIVSLFSQRTGCVLNLKRLENLHCSEISQAQDIVRACHLKGKVINFDALHCNQKTAALVIESGNDYIMALKKNQKKLYEQVEALIKSENPFSVDVTQEHSYGRKITRKVSIYQVNSYFHKGWKNLKLVIQINEVATEEKSPTKKKYIILVVSLTRLKPWLKSLKDIGGLRINAIGEAWVQNLRPHIECR